MRTDVRVSTEILIVGAGMAGLAAAKRLQEQGISHEIVEKASEVGGTRRDNRYPGLHVDVPMSKYQLPFAPKYDWSRPFAPGPEIQDYLVQVATDHGIRDRILFNAEVEDCSFTDKGWLTTLTDGRSFLSTSRLKGQNVCFLTACQRDRPPHPCWMPLPSW